MVDENVDEWVTPDEVAEVMLALIQQDKVSEIIGDKEGKGKTYPVGGGTIIEVGKKARAVHAFNDPGPVGLAGNTVSHMKVVEEEAFGLLSQKGWGTTQSKL